MFGITGTEKHWYAKVKKEEGEEEDVPFGEKEEEEEEGDFSEDESDFNWSEEEEKKVK